MSRRWISQSLAFAVVCWSMTAGQILAISRLDLPASKGSSTGDEKNITKILGGPDRYLTFVSTDKPIYHAGEKVYIRGVMLNAANHKPLGAGQYVNATIQIKGSRGDVVATGGAAAENSVWGFSWEVPEGQAGGEYTAYVTYPQGGHTPAERKFDIRAYRAPRLKSQITFLRDGYGPGDKVSATLDVKRAEGGIPQGAKVSVVARVDGVEIKGDNASVDSGGVCTVSFNLPHLIPRGEGTLSLVIQDGGVVETASKTIPILLQTVDLQIFPEGGELIAGYKNRVYVQANQPNGKPADLAGKLVSKERSQSRAVTLFHTEHEGRGRFEFTPNATKEYFLSIYQPAGITKLFPLPKIKSKGALISSDKDIFKKGQPVTVKVGCTDKSFRVTLAKREVEVTAAKKMIRTSLKAGALYPVSFNVPPDVDGVLTVTVWDEKGMPLAERLVFREPAKLLKITITPEKKSYTPGDNAKLTVKATDAEGKPVSTVVGLTVTDDSVLEMVDKREKAPRLPAMIFLEPEVLDLADAHVYLDPKNPKAPLATDLLLGTQGWRRFALMDLNKFIESNDDRARRVVALMGIQRLVNARIGQQKEVQNINRGRLQLPEEIGRVEGPRDLNMFQVEPTVIDERHYTSGRDERHQRSAGSQLAQLSSVDRYTFFPNRSVNGLGFSQAAPMMRPPQVMVREFAHEVRPGRKAMDRQDFAETLYWNRGVKTDPTTGEATINFGLSDSVTTFRVFADAFSSDGAVAAATVGIKAVQPFYAEAKLPLEVTTGDRILLPISLINGTSGKLSNVKLDVDLKGDFKLSALKKASSDIGTGGRVRWIQPIDVGTGNGLNDFSLTAKAGLYEDNVTRKLSVKPKGFPVETAFGGILEPGKTVVHSITITDTMVPRSLTSNTAIYPTPLSNLNAALERMIQDPNGCFEQTCSTSYPLTMAQQYFLSHTGIAPELVNTARQKLDAGYKHLVGFWCPDRGYEWFGENPGHEALTAFGLMHFIDMEKVRDVDQNMVTATRAWLLKQKDGQGGFTRKRRALHTWIEDKDCSNAYILWALLECGQSPADLKAELSALKTAASASQNYYVVALAANAFYLAGDKPFAISQMDRLAAMQKTDGSVDGIKSSIVGSGGESLEVEGTSLATLAWMREPKYAVNLEKSMKFLADSCKGGRFGSTQATVLALRAIVAYDKQRAHPKAPGKVSAWVDGQCIGDWVAFDQSTQGTVSLPDLSGVLVPGVHKLELRMEGGSPMPYSIAAKYNTLTPLSDKECNLNITTKMAQDKVVEGVATEANVTVINKSKDVIPNPVAVIGIPGGLEPRHDQLKELVKKGKIDAYEVRGREVVLYWRTLPGAAKVDVPLSLIAAVPGTYTGPASRAYLYYTDEHKKWVNGLRVEIAAK